MELWQDIFLDQRSTKPCRGSGGGRAYIRILSTILVVVLNVLLPRRQLPPVQSIPIDHPFQIVGLDIMALPLTARGNSYAIVFQDMFTKWLMVYATPDQKTERITKLLTQEIVPMFGVPEAGLESSKVVPVATVKAVIDSSAEVTIGVLLVPSDEDDDDNPSSLKGQNNNYVTLDPNT